MAKHWLILACMVVSTRSAAAQAVVTDGKFTNVYVYPNSDTKTWEQHIASLRPDAAQFSRAAIDKFTETIMAPTWPSYFDPLFQYAGIHPPRFFGSHAASKSCVDAALHDAHNGVVQWDTIRSLANCHNSGMDPSPQVNLIFSPDIKIAKIVPLGTGGEMCTTTTTRGWHAWGLNTPNFSALPTSTACMPSFASFTQVMTHEIVEILSAPAGTGVGTLGSNELADRCQSRSDATMLWGPYTVARYWSEYDKDCLPKLDPPAGSVLQLWALGAGDPLFRFTGDAHVLALAVPAARTVTSAAATDIKLVVQTGGDDLRGGDDNLDVKLTFAGGATAVTQNVNQGRRWGNGETHAVTLTLPAGAPRVSDITSVTLVTAFRGGLSGDNWNVAKAALVVSYPAGSPTTGVAPPVVHTWLDVSGGPLVRFTGEVHDHREVVPRSDLGLPIQSLTAIISTGNDDLRGGNDNCDVIVELADGSTITVPNANGGQSWSNWSDHAVAIPLPAGGLRGGDVTAVRLRTAFGGGIDGDNWNVNRLQLQATFTPFAPASPPGLAPKGPGSCASCATGGAPNAGTLGVFGLVALVVFRRRARPART